MRRLALAIAFACVLSGAMVRAGEIHTTGAVAQPTPSSMATMGEIHNTVPAASAASNTALTILLTLISIVP